MSGQLKYLVCPRPSVFGIRGLDEAREPVENFAEMEQPGYRSAGEGNSFYLVADVVKTGVVDLMRCANSRDQ